MVLAPRTIDDHAVGDFGFAVTVPGAADGAAAAVLSTGECEAACDRLHRACCDRAPLRMHDLMYAAAVCGALAAGGG